MDIEQARSKKSKAVEVLIKHQTDKAIDWLMVHRAHYGSPKNGSAQIDAKSVKRHLIFEHKEKHYELYFMNEKTSLDPGGELWVSGELVLVFEDSVVLKTSSLKADDDYMREYRIRWDESAIETILLSKWIEDIPEFANLEKIRSEDREKEDRNIAENSEIEKIESNVSLGDYE